MYDAVDILVDSEGDLVVEAGGDLYLATPQETLTQNILFRVKTDHLDYGPDPYIGANLFVYIETTNNRQKAEAMVEDIGISLQRNPFVDPNLLIIDAVPVGPVTMAAFVLYQGTVDGSDSATLVEFTITKEDSGVDNESVLNITEL